MKFIRGKSAAVILLCIAFISVATAASAQTAKITLPENRITLKELFGEIWRQTRTTVMFDAKDPAMEGQAALSETRGTVKEILDTALPGSGLTWMTVGNQIVIARLPEQQQVAPQPVHADFEDDVREYTRHNISAEHDAEQVTIQYDTLRTERPHSGIFDYPSRSFTPVVTLRRVPDLFARTQPPVFAVKTNLAWWAARGTINGAMEVGLGVRTSVGLAGGNNRWNLKGSAADNRKLVHWIIKPEFRYWLCERFSGHFFGVNALYGRYNVGGYDVPTLFKKEYRYEGGAWGMGLGYGYHLPLARRWGVEFTAGAGAMRLRYTKSDCAVCAPAGKKQSKTWFGPTNLGVKLVFIVK